MNKALHYLAEKGIEITQIAEQSFLCRLPGELAIEFSQQKDNYFLKSWEKIPGPGQDDFMVGYAVLDEALLAIWCFYFAKPIEIDGWVVPLHKRPFWTLSKFQYRLANLAHLSESQFERIKQTRLRRSLQRVNKAEFGLKLAEISQFLICKSVSHSNLKLMVRRDLEEAYIVQKER